MQPTIWQKLTNLSHSEDVKSEMVKKYRNTILKLVETNGRTVYGRYTGMNRTGLHVFRDLHDNELLIAQDTAVDVRIWYPRRGIYNVEYGNVKRFVYFARTANRQYRRGINEDNTLIQDPVLGMFQLSKNMYDSQILQQISENVHDYRHLDEVIPKLLDPNQNIISYAINDRWGITAPLTKDNETCHLWLYRRPIATIKDGHIKFEKPMFTQELLDEKSKNWFAGYDLR